MYAGLCVLSFVIMFFRVPMVVGNIFAGLALGPTVTWINVGTHPVYTCITNLLGLLIGYVAVMQSHRTNVLAICGFAWLFLGILCFGPMMV